jgi:hypothetical protein
MREHTFRVLLATRGNRHRIESDLEEKELAAIGYVVTQWAYLEHAVLAHTIELCSAKGAPLPKDATNLSFDRRLRAWRNTIQDLAPADKKKQLLALHSKAANLEQRRHKIAHGLWTWEYGDPETMTSFSFRPRVDFEAEFDFEGLVQLGHKIGEINFDLTYPGGKDEVFSTMPERGGYISRSFLLAARKSGLSKRRPRVGSPPKRTRRQSSRKA